MDLIAYVLSLAICFSGIFCGAILARIAREEIVSGKRYFAVLKKILAGGIAGALLFAFYASAPAAIGCALIVYIALSSLTTTDALVYSVTPAAIFLASTGQKDSLVIATLVFCLGFPLGSLTASQARCTGAFETGLKLLVSYGSFLVVGLTLAGLYAVSILH